MIKIAVALIIACSVIAAAILYHKQAYLFGLGFSLLVFNSVRRRLVFLIVSMVLKACVPANKRILVRRKIDSTLKHIRVRYGIAYRIYWRHARLKVKICTAIVLFLALQVLIIIVGHMLGIIAIIPIVGGVLLALGQLLLGSVWLKNFAIRMIAGMGLNKVYPYLWSLIPNKWRIYTDKLYKKMWLNFYAKPIVRHRMKVFNKIKERRNKRRK
jgi:hypothetical protein